MPETLPPWLTHAANNPADENHDTARRLFYYPLLTNGNRLQYLERKGIHTAEQLTACAEETRAFFRRVFISSFNTALGELPEAALHALPTMQEILIGPTDDKENPAPIIGKATQRPLRKALPRDVTVSVIRGGLPPEPRFGTTVGRLPLLPGMEGFEPPAVSLPAKPAREEVTTRLPSPRVPPDRAKTVIMGHPPRLPGMDEPEIPVIPEPHDPGTEAKEGTTRGVQQSLRVPLDRETTVFMGHLHRLPGMDEPEIPAIPEPPDPAPEEDLALPEAMQWPDAPAETPSHNERLERFRLRFTNLILQKQGLIRMAPFWADANILIDNFEKSFNEISDTPDQFAWLNQLRQRVRSLAHVSDRQKLVSRLKDDLLELFDNNVVFTGTLLRNEIIDLIDEMFDGTLPQNNVSNPDYNADIEYDFILESENADVLTYNQERVQEELKKCRQATENPDRIARQFNFSINAQAASPEEQFISYEVSMTEGVCRQLDMITEMSMASHELNIKFYGPSTLPEGSVTPIPCYLLGSVDPDDSTNAQRVIIDEILIPEFSYDPERIDAFKVDNPSQMEIPPGKKVIATHHTHPRYRGTGWDVLTNRDLTYWVSLIVRDGDDGTHSKNPGFYYLFNMVHARGEDQAQVYPMHYTRYKGDYGLIMRVSGFNAVKPIEELRDHRVVINSTAIL